MVAPFGAWSQTNECRYVYDGMLAIQDRDSSNVPVMTYTRGRDLSGTEWATFLHGMGTYRKTCPA